MGCLQKFHCTELEMGREMMVVDSNIFADQVALLTSAVSKLDIWHCKLLFGQRGQPAGHTDSVHNIQSVPSPTVNVHLLHVRCMPQLHDCGITLPHVRSLGVGEDSGDVDIYGLSHIFTQL